MDNIHLRVAGLESMTHMDQEDKDPNHLATGPHMGGGGGGGGGYTHG